MEKRNVKVWVITGILIPAILSGCAASSKREDIKTEAAVDMERDYSENETTQISESSMENKSVEDASGVQKTTDVSQQVSNNRKLIQTVSMVVETDSYDKLMPNIEAKIKELGGYIENSSTYNGSYYETYREKRTSDITARIPQNRMAEFVSSVEEKSNVTNKSQTTEDVTLQYVDMETHKKMLQTEQNRLLEFLEKAETMEDIIKLESRLSEIRYQIESMESQLRTYDNLVNYSTVNLTIYEVKIYTQQQEISVMEKIRIGFAENLYYVKEGLKNFIIGFIIRIPYMIVWAVIILICLFIINLIRVIVRKRRKKVTTVKTEMISENNAEKKSE